MTTESTSAPPAVERTSQPVETALGRWANRLVVGIARHWLALFNLAWGLYVFLPFLAPVAMAAGLEGLALVIYRVYSFACHQLPDHSYFLFGQNATPGLVELVAGGMANSTNLFAQRVFIGNEAMGYKVALCQRDVAIYGSVFLAGLAYGLLRHHIRGISFKLYLILLIPMAVDGLTQMVGLRESTWWLRTITGMIFGVASVWLIYPYVDEAMADVLETELARKG
jgi:uncharacterized membrane protein